MQSWDGGCYGLNVRMKWLQGEEMVAHFKVIVVHCVIQNAVSGNDNH